MIKTFPIEYVRQALVQTLYEQHLLNPKYFGGDDQISISSFYQQLKNQDEVDRFTETFRDLSDQQNRLNLIGNGIILAPENPTITNLYSSLIIPMEWTCSMRVILKNRDQMLETINNLIKELKGRKIDIAQLNGIDENGNPYSQPFMVGTLGENDGAPELKNGDYLGNAGNDVNDFMDSKLLEFYQKGIAYDRDFSNKWYYVAYQGKLVVVKYDNSLEIWYVANDDGTNNDIIFPPEHTSFDKYVLSMSFDSLRCDTPTTLNSNEYCEISFGGSATLVNKGVRLGNDLLKIAITKYLIPSKTPVKFYEMESNKTYWLEPLEMPSGSNANTNPIQRMSNNFVNNSQTNALALSLQYTFILDFNNELLEQLFYYARYGTQGLGVNDISPNIIYKINEIWCSWGEYVNKEIKAKIVENIDIENTESDTLTISMTFQLQGENN